MAGFVGIRTSAKEKDADRQLQRGSLLDAKAAPQGVVIASDFAGGAPRGNRNALKHGGYSTETLALKREIADLARRASETMAMIE